MAEEKVIEIIKLLGIRTMQKDIARARMAQEGGERREIDKLEEKRKLEAEEEAKEKLEKLKEEGEERKRKEMEKLRLEEEERKRKELEKQEKEAETKMVEEIRKAAKERAEREKEETKKKQKAVVQVKEEEEFKKEIPKLKEKLNQIQFRQKPLEQKREEVLSRKQEFEELLSPILKREEEIESEIKSLEEREKQAQTIKEKEEVESTRWKLEEKRRETEQRRWEQEKKMEEIYTGLEGLEKQIEDIKASRENLQTEIEERERRIKEIQLERQKYHLELELGKIPNERKPVESERSQFFGQKEKLIKSLEEISEKENQIDQEKEDMEEREKRAVTPRERREIEQQRWGLEDKRRTIERERWGLGKKIEEVDAQIENVNLKLNALQEREEKLQKRIKEIGFVLLKLSAGGEPGKEPVPVPEKKIEPGLEAKPTEFKPVIEITKEPTPEMKLPAQPPAPTEEEEGAELLKRLEEAKKRIETLKEKQKKKETLEEKPEAPEKTPQKEEKPVHVPAPEKIVPAATGEIREFLDWQRKFLEKTTPREIEGFKPGQKAPEVKILEKQVEIFRPIPRKPPSPQKYLRRVILVVLVLIIVAGLFAFWFFTNKKNLPAVLKPEEEVPQSFILPERPWDVFQEYLAGTKAHDLDRVNKVVYKRLDPKESCKDSGLNEEACLNVIWSMVDVLAKEVEELNETDFTNTSEDKNQIIMTTNLSPTEDGGYSIKHIYFVRNLEGKILVLGAGTFVWHYKLEELAGITKDTDGDNLTDEEENCLGANKYDTSCIKTNPDLKDTDGDGWWDSIEEEAKTDPNNPADYPFKGG